MNKWTRKIRETTGKMAIKIVCVTVCIKASEAKNYSEKENVNKKVYFQTSNTDSPCRSLGHSRC